MKLIDTEAAAVMLNSSRRHIQNLVARGIIPNRGKTRRILIDWHDVDQAVRDGKIEILHIRVPD